MTDAVAAPTNNSVLSSYLATQAQQKSAASSTASSSSSAASTQSAAMTTFGNFNTFLKILTTQLSHQDPSNATDPNQFTQELVQFAGVEQQLSTNSKLDTLINYAKSNTGTGAALSYMGQFAQVATTGNQLALQGGSSEVGYTLASAASSVNVYVQDATGKTIRTLSGSGTPGTDYVTWDGKDSTGNQMADGTYSFSIAATNSNGTVQTPTATYIIGKVTGVATNTDGTNNLTIGGLSFASTKVNAVYSAGNLPAPTAVSTGTTTGS